MQCWLISVVVVAISTMILLFIFSFDSLEYQQIGLNYSFLSESVEKEPYKPGRYYLGVTNRFIKFPRTVQSISFIDDWAEGLQGPALQSRTKDGLTVHLEVSFQYKLIFSQLYNLWATLGHDHYETTFTRMAMEQLSTATTHHNAHFFFRNRTYVSTEMHRKLDEHFRKHAFAEVPFFQLRTVHLPDDFEDAIRETQVQEQHIHIARLEQQKKKVTFATEVLKAEQAVKKINNEAGGEATATLTKNRAYCEQYKFTQEIQADALEKVLAASGWAAPQLLDFLGLRAVRDHPSENTLKEDGASFSSAADARDQGQDFQTLEGWCEEAVRRWNQTLSGSGEDEGQEARRFKAVSYTVRFLLAVILL
ncbi:unnamed protein product, partial [Symbiodinium microadriaticum]